MCETRTVDGDQRDLQVGRLVNDYLDRKDRGEAEPEEEFLDRHRDLADQLRMCLHVAGNLRASVITIGSLIERGVLEPNDDPGYPGRLRDYKIAAVVGEGATGIVLKAYEPRLDRLVALKILRPEFATTTSALTRFQREARAAAALRHPNIVTVHDLDQERGVHYVAMEYIPTTLAALIHERGLLPPATVRHIMRQLLSGLAAAHEANLIHRDIKPSNILIDCGLTNDDCRLEAGDSKGAPSSAKQRVGDGATPDPQSPIVNPQSPIGNLQSPIVNPQSPIGNLQSPIPNLQSPIVKVADFGLARTISAQTGISVPGRALGTPAYMSPEQADAQRLDHRTDLYSAGVVLYEMLTGQCPFAADSFTVLKDCILCEEPLHPKKLNKNADPHLASLALRLMAKRPEDRFASADEVRDALEADRRVISPQRRRRLRRSLAIALTGVAILTGGVWLASKVAFRSLEITAVQPDPDLPYCVQVRYGDNAGWEHFYEFPSDSNLRVAATAWADVDGLGHHIVAAGLNKPPYDETSVLFAFERPDEELWHIPLHSELHWPDCDPPTRWWHVTQLINGDLDGIPGEEFVVVAQDAHMYPTRISIVDAIGGEVRCSFWHFGHIRKIRVLQHFFEDGRPAILALGWNNELAGFKDGLRATERRFAHWSMVSAIMILDPADMDGLGPPPTNRLLPDICTVTPYAYAFLDLPHNRNIRRIPRDATYRDSRLLQGLEADFMVSICDIEDARQRPEDGTDPWFLVSIQQHTGGGPAIPLAQLIVDRNLTLRHMPPNSLLKKPVFQAAARISRSATRLLCAAD